MKKILITEDERILAEDLKFTLQNLGFDITGIASSGEAAIDKIEQIRPDLILMDIMLDGIQTARKILYKYKIPIIYITAYVDPKTMSDVKSTKPYGILHKPFEDSELHSVIDLALRGN